MYHIEEKDQPHIPAIIEKFLVICKGKTQTNGEMAPLFHDLLQRDYKHCNANKDIAQLIAN